MGDDAPAVDLLLVHRAVAVEDLGDPASTQLSL
jgi:hypothetical protein